MSIQGIPRFLPCNATPCAIQVRQLAVGSINGMAGDGLWSNMLKWANAFDLSNNPWGLQYYPGFDSPSATVPDPAYLSRASMGPGIQPSGILDGLVSQSALLDDLNQPRAGGVQMTRSQLWFPKNALYTIVAVDFWTGIWQLCCSATTTYSLCATLEVPIPQGPPGNPTALASPLIYGRTIYYILYNVLPQNIKAANPGGGGGVRTPQFGPNFDITRQCFPSPDDPFLGGAP